MSEGEEKETKDKKKEKRKKKKKKKKTCAVVFWALTENSPVSGSKPTCTSWIKSSGAEMSVFLTAWARDHRMRDVSM